VYIALQVTTWLVLAIGTTLVLWAIAGLGDLRLQTPRGLANALILAAVLGGAVDLRGWATAWMPNVVVGVLTVALTITVIERAFQREAQRKLQPRQDHVVASIGRDLELLLSRVAFDYAENPGSAYKDVPNDPPQLFELWESVQLNNQTKEGRDWYPSVWDGAQNFASRLERHR
jgi:hypothetical protein